MPTEPISSSPPPGPDRPELLSVQTLAQAIAFLQTRPIENAYLLAVLGRDARTLIGEETCVLHRTAAGDIDGFINFAQNVVLAGNGPQPARAFAQAALSFGSPRMIVGPRDIVLDYWQFLAPHYPPPRLVRANQPLLIVDRDSLRGSRLDAPVRPANSSEVDIIATHSAKMIEGELGYDPREARASFRSGVAQSVERGWWWAYIENGELLFMCNIGIATNATAQLQGVWTPPAARRRGIAKRALGAICDRLLDNFPTLSLYVNDFNGPALRLYDSLGFRQASAFSTILL